MIELIIEACRDLFYCVHFGHALDLGHFACRIVLCREADSSARSGLVFLCSYDGRTVDLLIPHPTPNSMSMGKHKK